MGNGRRPTIFLLAAVIIGSVSPLTASARQGSTWTELGGSASGGGISATEWSSLNAQVAVGPDGNPVVAWYESGLYGTNIFLRRWNGSSWVELGGSGSGSGVSGSGTHYAYQAMPAVGADGTIYVAFRKAVSGSNWEIFVLRWNGTSWENLEGTGSVGGVSASSTWSTSPSIAIDRYGTPWVAWEEGEVSHHKIYVRRWNGNQWVGVGGSDFGEGISNSPLHYSSSPHLALDGEGNPVVVWGIGNGGLEGPKVYLRRWNGSAWVELGGSATGFGIGSGEQESASSRGVVVGSSGNIFVLWEGSSNGRPEIYLRKWNGSAWVELGGSGTGYGISGQRPSNNPMAEEQHLVASGIDLDLNGNPIVVWCEGDVWTPFEVRARRWTGASWEGLEGSFDQGMGALEPDNGTVPDIAVANSGDVFITWDDGPNGDQEIYLRRWVNVRPTELRQFMADGVTPIGVGGLVAVNKVHLQAIVSRPGVSFPVKLQVEAQPIHEEFTGVPTAETLWIAPSSVATLQVSNLVLGGWKWRARAIESTGFFSPWVSFGGNGESATDFWVLESVIAKVPVQSPGSNDDDSKGCGLLGIEPVLLLAVLAAAWRRRLPKGA